MKMDLVNVRVRAKSWLPALGIMLATPMAELRAEWAPAESSMMTRWSADVSPDQVWEEYPRPQLVREQWQNLNGLWDYAVESRASREPADYEGKIMVPFCIESALSGVKRRVGPEDKIWYRRAFEVDPSWDDRRVILHFDAVDWETAVWVNGALVGTHRGAYDRFSFDITDHLIGGSSQELMVSVWDPTSDGEQARGKQEIPGWRIWYTPVSGIWQTVWLEAVPDPVSVQEIKITPDIDKGSVSVVPILSRATVEDYPVRVTVREGNRDVATAVGRGDHEITLEIPEARLWSPDSPFLYDLTITLLDPQTPSREIEQLDSYFGMRKISLGSEGMGRSMLLNNKPLFHYGTLDQGWWPDGLHTPPSDEAMRYDIELTKQMGFNMIRKHIKVESDRWFYWCDRLGLLVWQDMPSGMVVIPAGEGKKAHHVQHLRNLDVDLHRQSEVAAQYEWELRRMIDLHYNAPSIVMWVLFNEGWGQYDTRRVAEAVKGLDPTRLVNEVSGWVLRGSGDILDIHTYGVEVTEPTYNDYQASVVGEFGGIGYPIEGHLWNPEMRNWGYQTYHSQEELIAAYRHKFDQIVEMKKNGLAGAVYTQTTDVEGEVNGLITYDREVIKIAPETLREIHAPLFE